MSIRTTWLLILGVSTLALAQTNVLGTVLDGTNDLPIPKARIFSADSILKENKPKYRFSTKRGKEQEFA